MVVVPTSILTESPLEKVFAEVKRIIPGVDEETKYDGAVGVSLISGAMPRNAAEVEAVHDTSLKVPAKGIVKYGTYPAEVVAVHVVVVAVCKAKARVGDKTPGQLLVVSFA